jgi:hypothetical protein
LPSSIQPIAARKWCRSGGSIGFVTASVGSILLADYRKKAARPFSEVENGWLQADYDRFGDLSACILCDRINKNVNVFEAYRAKMRFEES